MVSPARRHWQRAQAAQEAAASGVQAVQTGDQYELMRAALIEDRRRLKDVQSIERKIELKRELLPQYLPYIQGVLEANKGAQDEVVSTIMVWSLDVGDLSQGIAIAEYMLKHGLQPAEQYQRSTGALLVEEAADTLLRENIKPEWQQGAVQNLLTEEDSMAGYLQSIGHLDRIAELTVECDMHDEIRAKLYKANGYLNTRLGKYQEAKDLLSLALRLNDRAGVKKDIERLEKLVNPQG